LSKKINVREVVDDINQGMHDNALMNKYQLSPGQLGQLFDKLETSGHLSHTQRVKHQRPAEKPQALDQVFDCPSCHYAASEEFSECPRCGLVLSKYEPPQQQSGPEQPPGEKKFDPTSINARPVKSEVATYVFKMAYALAAVALVAAAIVILTKVSKSVESLPAPASLPRPAAEDGLNPDDADSRAEARSREFTDLINQKMPNVKPINPELDGHMKRSFGEIGDSLDRRKSQGRDLTNE